MSLSGVQLLLRKGVGMGAILPEALVLFDIRLVLVESQRLCGGCEGSRGEEGRGHLGLTQFKTQAERRSRAVTRR